MNKETRIFVLGLLAVLLCGSAIAIHIGKMLRDTYDYSFINWCLFLPSLIGFLSGANMVYKTIK